MRSNQDSQPRKPTPLASRNACIRPNDEDSSLTQKSDCYRRDEAPETLHHYGVGNSAGFWLKDFIA